MLEYDQTYSASGSGRSFNYAPGHSIGKGRNADARSSGSLRFPEIGS
ncbi:uncharacterized protein METZ01_LOCUS607 [marine metagenome]|uniref:Uncharacterized protein n=1 Tax=marine metagenome TaxID=408172 RepID=A0A381N294_9ZZZZ